MAKIAYRPYRCMNCGHEQEIQTNHEGRVIDYCKGCSWKPTFGDPKKNIAGYRPFEFAGEGTNLQPIRHELLSGCDQYCDKCQTWVHGHMAGEPGPTVMFYLPTGELVCDTCYTEYWYKRSARGNVPATNKPEVI